MLLLLWVIRFWSPVPVPSSNFCPRPPHPPCVPHLCLCVQVFGTLDFSFSFSLSFCIYFFLSFYFLSMKWICLLCKPLGPTLDPVSQSVSQSPVSADAEPASTYCSSHCHNNKHLSSSREQEVAITAMMPRILYRRESSRGK